MSGWTHEEARQHDVVERLRERCSTYAGGTTCPEKAMPDTDWCERCIAASTIDALRALVET